MVDLTFRLIVIAYLPGALYSPCRIGSEIAFTDSFDHYSLGVPCEGDLVGLIRLKIELDATTGKSLAERMTSICCSYSNVPFTILGAALSCCPTGEEIVSFFYASSLGLTDGN